MNWYIIILFVLAFTLYLYTQYIRIENSAHKEKIEHFQASMSMTPADKLLTNHSIVLSFLPAQQASHQIRSLSHEYIALMNQPNLVARGFQTQSELLSAYSRAYQDITAIEQQRIIDFVLELLNKIQYKYPAYYRYIIKWISQISFVKSQASLENGMPHTLGNLIILDSGWFLNPSTTTFLHELTHIHQRKVPFEFEDLYTAWGYVSISIGDIRGMDAILQLNRNNPDGMNPNWLWHEPYSTTGSAKYWWIGTVFSSVSPSNLGDVNLIAVTMARDPQGNFYYLKQQPTPLHTLVPFVQYFGGSSPNNYHPNEMAAKFAEWYIEDMLGSPQHIDNSNRKAGYHVYKEYFNKLLETYY